LEALASAGTNTLLPDAPRPADPAPRPVSGDLPIDRQPHSDVTVTLSPVHVIQDVGHTVVSPIYLRTNDLKWLLPLTGAAATAFATDTHTMTKVVSTNPSFNQTAINVSNGLVWGVIATPIFLFGVGEFQHNPHARETGILGSEAMVDAVVADELVKLCAWRERPTVDNGQGEFFIGKAGPDSSFVSEHSMIAWSSAAVIAGEYHSRWMQLGVYTAAAGVSATRVLGQEHFPSDVLLGAAGGWLIGH
jgi:membrane-associated phospholipid phosphatase